MGTNAFTTKKCNTCVLVRTTASGGANVVFRVTGACSSKQCSGSQIYISDKMVNVINGRKTGPPSGNLQTRGLTKPPISNVVTVYEKWDCNKPAPASPGSGHM
jgi:hypothetical protein